MAGIIRNIGTAAVLQRHGQANSAGYPLSDLPFGGPCPVRPDKTKGRTLMPEQHFLCFPVVSAGAEHLVMGYLMRRNILTYKAPPNNEGYDLICIHPDPRHRPRKGAPAQVRVQVKSRYATDCTREFPVSGESIDAFDFLTVVFLNIGDFTRSDGRAGQQEPEFYTFPTAFIRRHHDSASGWPRVRLGPLGRRLERYRNEAGFELIANALAVAETLERPAGKTGPIPRRRESDRIAGIPRTSGRPDLPTGNRPSEPGQGIRFLPAFRRPLPGSARGKVGICGWCVSDQSGR